MDVLPEKLGICSYANFGIMQGSPITNFLIETNYEPREYFFLSSLINFKIFRLVWGRRPVNHEIQRRIENPLSSI